MWELIWLATLTVHYGDSLAIECTSVLHSFLRCIVGSNECTREYPFRTPLKMAVGYSLGQKKTEQGNDHFTSVLYDTTIVR